VTLPVSGASRRPPTRAAVDLDLDPDPDPRSVAC
jgi:hypothetical protein